MNTNTNLPMPQSKLAMALVCWFFGYLGIHSFMAGKTLVGILQLVTCGGLGICVLIDFIMILTDSYRDNWDRPLQK